METLGWEASRWEVSHIRDSVSLNYLINVCPAWDALTIVNFFLTNVLHVPSGTVLVSEP